MNQMLLMKKNARKSPVVYAALVADLSQAIRDGALAPGSRIAGENELAAHYTISRSSVRLALNELEAAGLIVKRPGKGSFVRDSSESPEESFAGTLTVGINSLGGANGAVEWYDTKIINAMLPLCEAQRSRLSVFDASKLHLLQRGFIDGAILLFWDGTVEELLALVARDVEPILFNRIVAHERIAYVSVDYRGESRRATEFLLKRGAKRIGMIRIGCTFCSNDLRYAGFSDALAGQTAEAVYCDVDALQAEEYYTERLTEFLCGANRPEALFLPNGSLATPAFLALRKLKLRVPEDIELMCFDDIGYLCKLYDSHSFYVQMPLAEMAADATRYLLDKLRTPALPVMKKLYRAGIKEC